MTSTHEARTTNGDAWLTVNEAASYLRVERSTLYRLMRQGIIKPSGRVGTRLRFHAADLDRQIRT